MIERQLHPSFWWIWASLLIVALVRSESLTLNLLTILICIAVYKFSEIPTNRKRVFALVLRIATIALAIRMTFAILIGVPMPGDSLFVLPTITLPDFLVGIRIGGPVTVDGLSGALSESSLFASLLIVFGLASAMSIPTRLIKILPHRLYGLGTATTIATNIMPSLSRSISRVRTAQFLRGQAEAKLRSWSRVATPVLEDSLSRSIDLAAALEARGYGINPRPTRYRPERWGQIESLAIASVAYLALFYPMLDISTVVEYFIFAALALIPVVFK